MKKYILIFCLTCFYTQVKSQLSGFILTGDPASVDGATWTYNATDGGILYNLKGVLFKPTGVGPFPSVNIIHGTGGNTKSTGYSVRIAKEMVQWGYVCIATNYCHMGTSVDFPCGSPGDCNGTTQVDWGAAPIIF